MSRIITRALIDAIGTALYIILIVLLINVLQQFSSKPDNTILIPIAMLLLFVFSAALTGFLVFGKPVMLYLEGKKKSAVSLIAWTLGFLLVFTVVAFILLLGYLSL